MTDCLSSGRSPQGGDVPLIRCALGAGASHDAVDRDGRAPLHWAALWGQAMACRALATHGAPLETEDAHGATPLEIAEAFHHGEV